MAKNRVFFAFCLIENHRDIWEMGCGNKKCLFIIYKHFLFYQLNIFSSKIFHDGHRTWKHGKFKSKKQIFSDFCFLLHEAPLDPNKGPCKKKNDLSKIWASYGRLKVFGCRWLNFAASGGQNMRLSQFSFAYSRSARKTGRFDILTSKSKNFFEIMVIWCKCKP